ncbi:MAG: sugar phosphate isomerase/epimerase [Chloroflexi bacterium]|nr:sugar phosphate isomerase/epimerase [Chloroflexota bacterium]
MKLCYMSTTPEVRGPMPLAWLADLDTVLPAVAELGYQGIELQTRNPAEFDHKSVRQKISDAGLELVALSTGPIGIEDGLYLCHKDADTRRRAVERYRSILELAAEWGVDSSIGGFRGRAASAPSREEGLAWFRSAVETLAEQADRLGRKIVLEPQCRINTDFLMTIGETVEFIKSVGAPNLVLEADMFHMALEETSIVAALVTGREYLAHVQLGDSNRLAPGRGFLPWRDIVEVLRALGYDSWLSMEFTQKPDSPTAARQAIDFIRPLIGT